jgi:hypothetical protein
LCKSFTMQRNLYFLSLFLLTIIFFKSFDYQYVHSISVPFERQEIYDPPNDAQLYTHVFNYFNSTNNYNKCIIANKQHDLSNPPDIGEVGYLSDGKTLNATIWLNSAFEKLPSATLLHSGLSQTNFSNNKNVLTINISNLPINSTNLPKYFNKYITSLKQTIPDLNILSKMHIIIGGKSAYLISYNYKKDQQDLQASKILILEKNKLYTITYISEAKKYSKYLPIFQNMIKSFKIISDTKNENNNTNDNLLTYRNITNDIEIQYPKNWKEQQLLLGDKRTNLIAFFAPIEDQFVKDGRYFMMFMGINSAYFLQGTGYLTTISWNPSSQTWIKEVDEMRALPGKNGIINPGDQKVLELDNNYTGFEDLNKNYAVISAKLSDFNYPNQYFLSFGVMDDYYGQDSSCSLIDITDHVNVPPPQFNITTIPNSVVLRPGEEKDVELIIKNINTNFASHAFLYSNSTKEMNIKFIPDQVSIPPLGMTTSLLHIKSLSNTTIHPYTFPIIANMTFPTKRENYLSNEILNNNKSATIVERSVITATVLEPIPIEQKIDNFLTAWFTPITSAYSTIITIVSGIVGWQIWKRRGKGEEKKK